MAVVKVRLEAPLIEDFVAQRFGVLVLDPHDAPTTFACPDPLDPVLRTELSLVVGRPVTFTRIPSEALAAGLNERLGIGSTLVADLGATSSPLQSEVRGLQGGDSAISAWVYEVLNRAIRERSTDVHFEPRRGALGLRYRVDGVLHELPVPRQVSASADSVVARVKVLARLDLGERRLPQDGRIRAQLEGRPVDLRVSVLPTLHGETVDIRILEREGALLDLEHLGMPSEDRMRFLAALHRPHGVILLSGPTGSGKTTTLYASLRELQSAERKIITIEDPVEYELQGVTQIQVNPKIGLTFSRGLRSMLRHDPDIMLVGEVRDPETADVTIQVALTGHLVLSTVHTNDAPSVVTRLLNMGVEPYLVASSLQCAVAQRLVRVLCGSCRREERLRSSVPGYVRDDHHLPVGCPACRYTGYHGRTAIHEIFMIDDEIRDLILARAPSGKLRAAGVRKGMRSLRQAGLEKAAQGRTSIAEVVRVAQEGAD
jgi:type II secretory ATPase GspE/PulE/Tfp pilus assembly ATPase PilB-like protein